MRIKVRKRQPKRNFLIIIAILLVCLLFISAGAIFLNIADRKSGYFSGEDNERLKETFKYNGQRYSLKDNVETVLLLGLDSMTDDDTDDTYSNDKRADFVILVVFDNDAKTCTAVQLNRDTMADVNILGIAGDKITTVKKQLALAHAYGDGRAVSCRNVADSVSKLLLGVKISNYLSVEMDAVPVYNDLLGGVEVEINEDFSNVDPSLVMGEKVTLTGEQALSFVRARAGMEEPTNIARMTRQRQYMKSAYNKTKECFAENNAFPAKAYLKMSDYLISNTTDKKLQSFMKKACEYEFLGIRTIDGESEVKNNLMEFYPDEDAVTETVLELFYE